MQVFKELTKNSDLSLALGFFDGVHLGHAKVVKSAVDFALKNGGKSACITFKHHPCCFFYDVKPEYILSEKDKFEKFESLGLDYLYILDFDEKIAKLSAENYLSEILIKNFAPKSISTGFNHNFGAEKTGSPEFLKKLQEKYGYKYFEIPPEKYAGEIISSTAIRNFIAHGNLEQANSMLGYNFFIKGKVESGRGFGEKLGFKTANINYPDEIIKLPFGVYEVRVGEHKGVANFGVHPSVDKAEKPVLEVHLLDFERDIYNEFLTVDFVRKIRDEKIFATVDALKKQIQEDIKTCSR